MNTQADMASAVRKSLDPWFPLGQVLCRIARAGERCVCGERARTIVLIENQEMPSCCLPSELRSLLGKGLEPCPNHDDATRRQMDHE